VAAAEAEDRAIYLVLPSTPMAGREGAALTDRELESVADAGTWGAESCQMTCGDDCYPTASGMFGC
jgi:hypothetical protein